jgi:hypothetical protein
MAFGLLLCGGVAWARAGGQPNGAKAGSVALTGIRSSVNSGNEDTSETEASDSSAVEDTTEGSTDTTVVNETTTVVLEPSTTIEAGDNNDQGEDNDDQGENTTTTVVGESTTTTIVGETTTTLPCVEDTNDNQNGDSQGEDDAVAAEDGAQHSNDCGDNNDQGEDANDSSTTTVPTSGSPSNDQ